MSEPVTIEIEGVLLALAERAAQWSGIPLELWALEALERSALASVAEELDRDRRRAVPSAYPIATAPARKP